MIEPGGGYLHDPPPINTVSTVSNELLRRQHLVSVVHCSLLEKLSVSYENPCEKTLEACPQFPPGFTHTPFSFADFALYPPTVIKDSHE